MPTTPTPLPKTIYTGTFISTPVLNSLQVLEKHAVGVDEEGVIRFVCTLGEEVKEQVGLLGWEMGEVRWVEGGGEGRSWWFPGFVGGWDFFFFISFLFWFYVGGAGCAICLFVVFLRGFEKKRKAEITVGLCTGEAEMIGLRRGECRIC